MDVLAQGGILIGAMAVLALGSGSRWGFVLSLCVQPFWFLHRDPPSPMGNCRGECHLRYWVGAWGL